MPSRPWIGGKAGFGSRGRQPRHGAEQGEESERGHDGEARYRVSVKMESCG